MLKFEHVTKVYGGKKALNDLTLSFLPGHVYALVGPNGSGKSTMMKVAAGLVKPNSGSATYQEMPIGVESKKHIAYMCTEPFYYDYMKIQDVKQFYADFFADFDKERFDSLLQFMQLTPDMKVRSLSSGMAAKLKIAATLARNADICMLDEPLNGIDLVGRDQIIQSILRAANPNATILISIHLFDELEPIVDHIVMMANGSLILEGELEEIRTRYGKSISDLYREYFSGTAASPLFPNNTNQPTV
jgi:ABC-2 type transport system ATP-binding protein